MQWILPSLVESEQGPVAPLFPIIVSRAKHGSEGR